MNSNIAPGLLVAAPPLGDPNFDRSVVMLASHGPEGAFGWVVNGRELVTLPELLVRAGVTEQVLDLPGMVRVGGPVSPEQVWLVYRAEDRFPDIEGQFEVGDSIIASASKQVLEAIASGAPVSSLVALAGYAGWAPMQLEEEIRRGAWLPVDLDAHIVFDGERARGSVWERAYALVGTNPMAFAGRNIGSA